MHDVAYSTESKIEQNHWWFVVRRRMFAKYLFSYKRNISVLDIGSSSGTNLRLLKDLEFTNYKGFDFNILSKKFCEEKDLGEVIIGDICNSNLRDNSYDVILITDVIEHIYDDSLVLKEIFKILKPGGQAIITVPCFMSLWGDHDEVSMHKRRYLMKEITSKVRESGMHVLEKYYFNFLLFIPIFIFRKLIKLFNIKIKSENNVNSLYLNKLLKLIFIIDVSLAKKIPIPFGVSAFILATKPK